MMFLIVLLNAAILAGTEGPLLQAHACGWSPPSTARHVVVRNTRELLQAVRAVEPQTTILLENGVYALDRMLDLPVPGTVLRSRSGHRDDVTIRGSGMTEGLGVALSVSAADVTIADLTVGFVRQHAVQVRGERAASRFTLHNVRLVDSGQQLLKGSVGTDSRYADDGLVACSLFEFTDTAPSSYTDGVDLLATKGWVIRDNEFRRIRGPRSAGYKAGPAILVWANAQDTIVERNLIVDSFRGIALGLVPGTSPRARDGERRTDHQRGVVRNNVVCNRHEWADEAIEANASSDILIEHNTVLTAGAVTTWSIGIRYAATSGVVRNNLTTRPFLRRDGGSADQSANIVDADETWFVDAPACDLHLAGAANAAIDAAIVAPDALLDFDRAERVGLPDIGAFEYRRSPGERPRR